MTWLPEGTHAEISRDKIVQYLLNDVHRYGRAKSRYFRAFGFSPDQPEALRGALREHPMRNEVVRTTLTEYEFRYVVECTLRSPDGRDPCIVTVWQIAAPGRPPRLITAYPGLSPRNEPDQPALPE